MPQTFSTCPYKFHVARISLVYLWKFKWDVNSWFVTPCGIWPQHDQTNPFSYYMEGKSEQTGKLLLTSSWRLVLSYLGSPWRVDRETQVLSSMPFCVGMTGFSWSKPLMCLSWQTCTDLGWFNLAIGKIFFLAYKTSTFEVLAMSGECGIACW